MINLWKHINKNYASNRAFARANNISINTVQTAIDRGKHFVNESTGDVLIKNKWNVKTFQSDWI